jgi:hypothetical protein
VAGKTPIGSACSLATGHWQLIFASAQENYTKRPEPLDILSVVETGR